MHSLLTLLSTACLTATSRINRLRSTTLPYRAVLQCYHAERREQQTTLYAELTLKLQPQPDGLLKQLYAIWSEHCALQSLWVLAQQWLLQHLQSKLQLALLLSERTCLGLLQHEHVAAVVVVSEAVALVVQQGSSTQQHQ
jgi:hypothetical protein